MPERSQVPLQKSQEKISESLSDSENLLKLSKPDKIQSASFSTMYQYATRQDYLTMSVGLIANVIFSCLPVVLVLKIGNVIDIMQDYQGDLQKFYEEERETAIIQFILGVITVALSWIAVATFIKLGNNQGVYWKHAYFAAVINSP